MQAVKERLLIKNTGLGYIVKFTIAEKGDPQIPISVSSSLPEIILITKLNDKRNNMYL